MNRKAVLYLTLLIFILLFIRLFTCRIDFQREEDPTIILKGYPTKNNIFLGSDTHIKHYMQKYEWYKNNQFLEIIHTNGSSIFINLYDLLTKAWILPSIVLLISFFRKILYRYK